MSTLSDRVKECLTDQPEKTKTGLANACGISLPSVSDWVSGKTKSIQGENLIPAANYLNVDPHWLATGKGKKHRKTQAQAQEQPRSEVKNMLVTIIDDLNDEELTFDRVKLIREALLVKKRNIPKSTDVLYVLNHKRPEYQITKKDKKVNEDDSG